MDKLIRQGEQENMIKHIVLWKLKNRSTAESMKNALEALPLSIPQIRSFEVGVGKISGDVFSDIVLVSSFDNADDLETYAAHPDHQKVVAIVRELTVERRVIDYVV